MKKLLSLLLIMSPSVYAYKMTIYTDQPEQTKAREVLSTFKNTYPFNQFEIDFEIKTVSAGDLNCEPYRFKKPDGTEEVINRNLTCHSSNIAREAAKNGIDQALIVKNVEAYGGSGGSIPVMSIGSPPEMMLHEYLHTLGLCDEYEYKASEAGEYCDMSGPNMTFIEPDPEGYPSDAKARNKHSDKIPWYSFIKPQTLITRGTPLTLGTDLVNNSVHATPNSTNAPSVMGAAIGLYEGKTCKNANPPKKTWQPGREASIMEFLDAGLGAGNEQLVAKILESRGVRRKLAEENPPERGIFGIPRRPKEILDVPVNNSSESSNSSR